MEVDRYLLLRDVIVLSNADGIFRDPSAIAACSLFPIGYFFLAVFSLESVAWHFFHDKTVIPVAAIRLV